MTNYDLIQNEAKISNEAKQLLKSMLRTDPGKRATFKEILESIEKLLKNL